MHVTAGKLATPICTSIGRIAGWVKLFWWMRPCVENSLCWGLAIGQRPTTLWIRQCKCHQNWSNKHGYIGHFSVDLQTKEEQVKYETVQYGIYSYKDTILRLCVCVCNDVHMHMVVIALAVCCLQHWRIILYCMAAYFVNCTVWWWLHPWLSLAMLPSTPGLLETGTATD